MIGGLVRRLRTLAEPPVPPRISSCFRPIDQQGLAALEEALHRHYFAARSAAYFDSSEGRVDMSAHLTGRLEACRRIIVPWLDSVGPLAGTRILEIGCGTGSDLVALAEQGADVTGLDLNSAALAAAEERLRLYGVTARLAERNAAELSKDFAGERFDWVIFYASLEHMTIPERLASLRAGWDLLTEGGRLCVIETPNRLWFRDGHTAWLPFFHWLPDELAFQFARHSPRKSLRDECASQESDAMMGFLRSGRGVSFHEFSLAIAPAESLEVASALHSYRRGTAGRTLRSILPTRDDRYAAFLKSLAPEIHPAFYREQLDLILRKAVGASGAAPAN